MKLSTRERQLVIALVVLLVVYLAIQVLGTLALAIIRVADVLLIFIFAWAVAYLLSPLVDAIDRRTPLDRVWSVLVVYLAIALALAGVVALAVPALAAQLTTIAENGPRYQEQARAAVAQFQETLDRTGIGVNVVDAYGRLPERIGDVAGSLAADALGFAQATAAVLVALTLVLIIAFIMLMDGETLWKRFTGVLSEELASEAELFRQSADRSFGGFMRGSLLIGLFYGIGSLLILMPLGVPFAGLLALIAGVTAVIPFFGPIIGAVPVLALTLLAAPDRFIWVAGLTILLQQVVFNILAPRILSKSVGIHPLFVFLALLLGSRIAGMWGVFLAMPVAGVVNTFVRYGLEVAQGRRTRTEAATLIEDVEAEEAEAAAHAKEEAAEAKKEASEADRAAARTKEAARQAQ